MVHDSMFGTLTKLLACKPVEWMVATWKRQ